MFLFDLCDCLCVLKGVESETYKKACVSSEIDIRKLVRP